MSTLVSSYLQDRATGKRIGAEMNVDCTPKAFCAWDGVTMGAVATFNITSIQDSAVGNWVPLLTVGFNNWHCPWGAAHHAGVFWAFASAIGTNPNAINVSTSSTTTPGTMADCNQVQVGSVGRLA